MDGVRDVLLLIHLIGFASLFGGALVQIRDEVKVVNAAMLHGALLQVLSGILLVGVIEGMDDPINHAKVGVKFAVALVIALLCWVNRRKESVPNGLFHAIMLMTLANVVIAVFW